MGGSRSRRASSPARASRAAPTPDTRPLHRRIPRHSHRIARPARPAHRFARRLARRHPPSIASRSRRASPIHPPRTATDRTPSPRRTARAPRWIFASRARARRRAVARRWRAFARSSSRRGVPSSTRAGRRRASSRVYLAPRLVVETRVSPSRRRDRRRRLRRVIVRCVIRDGFSCAAGLSFARFRASRDVRLALYWI